MVTRQTVCRLVVGWSIVPATVIEEALGSILALVTLWLQATDRLPRSADQRSKEGKKRGQQSDNQGTEKDEVGRRHQRPVLEGRDAVLQLPEETGPRVELNG